MLDGVDFSVKKGTVLAILGPNGAGKTTTVRILSTLLLPDGGQILIHGFNVVREADKVHSLIGLTGQYAAVDEYLTGSVGSGLPIGSSDSSMLLFEAFFESVVVLPLALPIPVLSFLHN